MDAQKIYVKNVKNNTIFLLDEAYYYYYKINTLPLIKKMSNLIITRSMSKAWGLAGARIGMVFSNPKNIDLLAKQRPMHEINQLSVLNNSEEVFHHGNCGRCGIRPQPQRCSFHLPPQNFSNVF